MNNLNQSINDMNQTTSQTAARPAMPVGPTLQVLADLRDQDQIVVTSQGSAREWPKVCEHPLDFHYIPSAMSGNIPLGLGLALAQPHRHVLAFTGDGSLLMNLGSLVTIVASGAKNLTVVLVDNGVYEVTGGQKTAASDRDVDFAGFARAAGFPTVGHFDRLDSWRREAAGLLQRPGPRFVSLVVDAMRENYLLDPPCPIVEQVARLRAALLR
jgi:thiamine pyrophosphate-dependent acetolactate synthase large subunit-like protein